MSDAYTHRDYSFNDDGMSFCYHMDRMTAEKLHSKAEIASELAWRDDCIRDLEETIVHALSIMDSHPSTIGEIRQILRDGLREVDKDE